VADLDTQSSILATSTAAALIAGDKTVADRNVNAVRGRSTLLVVALYTADGKLLSSFVRPGEAALPLQLQAVVRSSRVSGAVSS